MGWDTQDFPELRHLKDADPADPDALAAWCAEKLAAFKVPSHWEIRSEPLPRNAAGKVVKTGLTGEAAGAGVEE